LDEGRTDHVARAVLHQASTTVRIWTRTPANCSSQSIDSGISKTLMDYKELTSVVLKPWLTLVCQTQWLELML